MLACRRILNSKGTCIAVGGGTGRWMIGPLTRGIFTPLLSLFISQSLSTAFAKSNREDLTIMHDLMKAGKVRPAIDRCYKLNDVPEAIRHLEEGHARGKVIITFE